LNIASGAARILRSNLKLNGPAERSGMQTGVGVFNADLSLTATNRSTF